MSGTKFYTAWQGMHQRTTSDKYHASHRYKGRGIVVCERWKKFENFHEDMYASFLVHVQKYGANNTSIDRIENDDNYSAGNCRWATRTEQCSNQASNLYIKYLGRKMPLNHLAEKFKMERKTLRYRIFNMGLSPEEAVMPGKRSSNISANRARWGAAGARKFKYNGKLYTVKELSMMTDVKYATLKSRLFLYNWNTDRAMMS